MAVSQFPPKTTASIQYVDAPSANVYYAQNLSLTPGVYTITCVSTTVVTIDFWASDNSLITTQSTSSGTLSLNLTSACTRITYVTNTGSNVRVAFQLAGVLVGSGTTGTLDTITASGTYTPAAPGVARVALIGGGGGGGHGGVLFSSGVVSGGCGGGSGYLTLSTVQLTGTGVSVTLGAGGAATGVGGTTSFGALTALGGDPGAQATGATNNYGGGNGGSQGGMVTSFDGQGGGSNGSPGSGVPLPTAFATPGSGGAAGDNTNGGGGAGGGIYAGGGAGGTRRTGGGRSGGGGGGGGGVAGTAGTSNPPSFPSGGGSGGAGRVFVLRWA